MVRDEGRFEEIIASAVTPVTPFCGRVLITTSCLPPGGTLASSWGRFLVAASTILRRVAGLASAMNFAVH